MSTFMYGEDSGHTENLEARTWDEAIAEGEQLLREGEWEPGWVIGYVYELDEDGDHIETRHVTAWIAPDEPACDEGDEHSWNRYGGVRENPGVWGIGGAAIMTIETCDRCGMQRETISGDTNPVGAGCRDGVTYRDTDGEILLEAH